ncbi:MAG: 2-methylisocitrate lyase-like PEP mutase family enzyme [Oceanospirillaceae bacterium]|jgi:2-methylisocitrate lyase-like PEP mutase family enzyme
MTKIFRELHNPGQPFILFNAWDIGSARMYAALGAKAIGTSSAAFASTLGEADMGIISRDKMLAHAQDIVSATKLPVSGDFENGFGDDPDTVSETVKLAVEIGLAGISIEDTQLPSMDTYDFELAVERIKAAASTARTLSADFMLVARADGLMNNSYDLTEAINRIKAYEKAGADCVYIPVLPDLESVKRVCESVSIPVNVLAAGVMTKLNAKQFGAAGVARISLGSANYREIQKSMYDTAIKILNEGDFSRLAKGLTADVADNLLEKGK